MHAPDGLDVWFQKGLTQHGVMCEAITLAVAHAAWILTPIHNDPPDRFTVATAKVLGGNILSPDSLVAKCPDVSVEW